MFPIRLAFQIILQCSLLISESRFISRTTQNCWLSFATFLARLLIHNFTKSEGGDRVVVPWYQRGGTWYNVVQMCWNLVPKVWVLVPSLYESVLMKISSMDDFGIF